jgi:hypothetical protein
MHLNIGLKHLMTKEAKNQQENKQVGETIENMVDTLTGDNQNNSQQGEHNNQKNRS